MTQRKIAKKAMAAYCDVTPGAVSNWFSSNRISKENLAKVAEYLKMDVSELITGVPASAIYSVDRHDALDLRRKHILEDVGAELARYDSAADLRRIGSALMQVIESDNVAVTVVSAQPTRAPEPAKPAGASKRGTATHR